MQFIQPARLFAVEAFGTAVAAPRTTVLIGLLRNAVFRSSDIGMMALTMGFSMPVSSFRRGSKGLLKVLPSSRFNTTPCVPMRPARLGTIIIAVRFVESDPFLNIRVILSDTCFVLGSSVGDW